MSLDARMRGRGQLVVGGLVQLDGSDGFGPQDSVPMEVVPSYKGLGPNAAEHEMRSGCVSPGGEWLGAVPKAGEGEWLGGTAHAF